MADIKNYGLIGIASNVQLGKNGGYIDYTGGNFELTTNLGADANLSLGNAIVSGLLEFGSLTDGTLTITGFIDDDTLATASATTLATSESIKAYVDAQFTAADLDFQADTGGALDVDLDSEIFTIAGGTNINTVGADSTVTINLDDNVTLAGNISAVNGTFSGTITDGIATLSAGNFATTGNVDAGIVKFGSLTDTGEDITITKFVDEADGIINNDNDTTIPTTAAVIDYVTNRITQEDLDFAGDTGTGNVDLDSQTFTVAGGTNITTTGSGQTLTIDLDDDVVLTGNLSAFDGNFSNDVTATGTVEGSTLTDGTLTITGGAITGATGNIVTTGTVQGGTITDGTATLTGGDLTTTGNVSAADGTFSGNVSFGSLTDTGEGITITKFVDEADGIINNDTDTTIPTTAAIIDYVSGEITTLENSISSANLDVTTDSGTSPVINLATEALSILGGTNINTVGDATGNSVTVNLDSEISLTNVTATGTVSFGTLTDGTISIGSFIDDDTFATASNTNLATSESVKAYVDAQVGAVASGADLNIAGDTGTGAINLATETLTIEGTANEITTVFDGVDTLTIGLPDNVTVTTSLTTPLVDSPLIQPTSGDMELNADVTITGNLTVQGDQVIVESTVTTYQDPVLYLQSNTLISDTGLDVGIHFNYWDIAENTAEEGFFGWSQARQKFVFETSVIEDPQNVFATGDIATVVANIEGNISGATGTFSGNVSFGSLVDTGEGITITKFVDEADGIAANDNDTTIPTSAAVKDYVDTLVTAQDLDFAGDTGTGNVDLDSQSLTIAGGTNITTTGSGQTLTVDLDNNITLTGNVSAVNGTFTGNVGVSGDVAFGSLTDTGEGITITKFVDEADGLTTNDNDTTVPTSAAVIDYVTTFATTGAATPDGLLVRGTFTANSTDSTFNVGPVPSISGRTYYADKIVIKVTTAFAGDSFNHILVKDNNGAGVTLVAADDADGSAVGTYFVDLTGTETLTAGQNVQVQFMQSNGTTPSVVTGGAVTVSVHYNWV
jgi:hypothetical protein